MVSDLSLLWCSDLYIAPEVFQKEPFYKSVDAFSFGLILFEVCSSNFLSPVQFQCMNGCLLMWAGSKTPVDAPFLGLSSPFDSPTGPTWNRCLRACKLGQVQHQKALQEKEPTRMYDLRLLRTVTSEEWKSKHHSESSTRILFSFFSIDLWKFHFLSSAFKTISCQQAFGLGNMAGV
jgi:serine/threonine protein kinase